LDCKISKSARPVIKGVARGESRLGKIFDHPLEKYVSAIDEKIGPSSENSSPPLVSQADYGPEVH